MNNLESIIEKLKLYRAEHFAKCEAWEGVTLKKKSDGGEYARIGDALTGGARLMYPFYESSKLHPEIKIYISAGGRAVEDDIKIFGFLDENPAAAESHEIRRESCYRATYILNADEIREAIQKRAAWHAAMIESYAQQIKAAKKAYNQYKNAIKRAEEALKANSGCLGERYHNSLYYAIKEAIN